MVRNSHPCVAWSSFVVFLLGCIVLSGCPSVSRQGNTNELHWKFQAGDRFGVETTNAVRITSRVSGLEPNAFNTDRNVSEIWTAEDVDQDGTAKIARRFEAIRIVLSDPGVFESSFDSSAPNEGVDSTAGVSRVKAEKMAAKLGPVVGRGDLVRLTKRGEVLESRISESETPTAAACLEEFLRDVNLKETCTQMTGAIPRQVSEGAKWEASYVDPLIGGIVLTFVHQGTIERDGARLVKIKMDGRHDPTIDPGTRDVEFVRLSDFQMTGETFFDQAAGSVIECIWRMETVSEGILPDGTAIQSRCTVNQTVKISRLAR